MRAQSLIRASEKIGDLTHLACLSRTSILTANDLLRSIYSAGPSSTFSRTSRLTLAWLRPGSASCGVGLMTPTCTRTKPASC